MNFRHLHVNGRRTLALQGRAGLVAANSALRGTLDRQHLALRKLAHDLRNPLNSILLMAQLLEETGGSPEAARIALRIQKQCDEMNRMVSQAVPGR